MDVPTVGYLVASMCTVGAILFSTLTILQHLVHTEQPQLRTYTIRVLLMVPIYAIEALLGLVMHDFSEIFEVLRQCYEAFTLFSFIQLMLSYLAKRPYGGAPSVANGHPQGPSHVQERPAAIQVALDLRQEPQVHHIWPFNNYLKGTRLCACVCMCVCVCLAQSHT